jgi:transcriptional antiterminator NusG
MGHSLRELCLPAQQDESDLCLQVASWYAVVIKSQQERMVSDVIQQKGIESFLPLFWAARRWSDRVKRLQLPLFPGYLFCRFAPGQRLHLLRTPGVKSIVSVGPDIAPVADDDIQRIRRMVTSGCTLEPWPFLQTGQKVRIHDGPLTGMEGILTEFRGAWRVLIGLELLQRSVIVQLAREQVTPI